MNNYKIKFKNGRTTTICCSSNEELKSDLIECTKRFNSEIATINDMPTEKLSVGGFLVGTFLGGILGNAVAKSGVKKTAKTISKRTKNTISKTRKGVSEFRSASSKSKKYSGGGSTSGQKVTLQEQMCLNGHTITGEYYIQSERKDNKGKKIYVVLDKEDGKTYECEIPSRIIMEAKSKFSGGGSTNEQRYPRLADDTGKGISEGFVIGDGEMYFENEDNLVKHLRSLDYEDADGNSSKDIKSDEDLKEFFYNDEYYYYTEWEGDEEIEEQGYYYTRDGKEIEIASKGKKIPSGTPPRWWNKDVKEYMFFVFNTKSNKVWAGNEYENDAKDELKEFLLDNPELPLKVLSKRAITNKKINPLAYENWGRSTEIIAEIRGEDPEQMARGSKIKSKTTTQMIKALVKDLENTPYSIGLAILRERILTYSEIDMRSLKNNPKNWSNPIISLGMYKDYYSRVNKELNFDSRKDNVKAVKGLVKDLENTPYSIGLVILRERLYGYAENDLKAMEKNPENWSNPFISLGMYKDYANKVIENLKFEYETGGNIGSMAMAGAMPELAIADQISQRLPATTSAVDKRIAERIYSERPSMWEDRGLKHYAGGGGVDSKGKPIPKHILEFWKNFADGDVNTRMRSWYMKTYPQDNRGQFIDLYNTFEDLWTAIQNNEDVYNVIVEGDSLIRERLFDKLSKIKGVKYNYIYNKWLFNSYNDEYAKGGGVRKVNGREYSSGRNWTNDHRHHNKSEDYEVPQADRKRQYAKGGMIGENITFKHWSGDTKNGTITEDLGEGNFQVSSGFGNVLVNQEDIISSGTKSPERKKMFGFFKGGGSTEDKLLKELQNASNKTYGKGGMTYSLTQFPIYAGDDGKITYQRNAKKDIGGKGYEPEYAVSIYIDGKKMRYEDELYFDTEQKANLWTQKLNDFQKTIMTPSNKNYVRKYITENDDRISELIYDELRDLNAKDFQDYLPKTKKKKYSGGGGVSVGYNVFNYTDNIYATDEVFKTKALANKFIKEFRNRFANQGYYRDNRMNKIDVQDIDLLAIPSDFNPLKKYENGGFVPNGYVTLIFNKKSYDFPAIYEKVNQKLILEDMDLDNSLHTPELMEFLNKEFYDWLESSNPSSEYEEMYFGEEAVFSKSGALDYAVELIMESLFEKKNQNNQQAVLNLDKYEVDYIYAFEG